MINATEMAKPFGKKTYHFLENDESKKFREALSLKLGIPSFRLIQVERGRYGSTWMHQDVALEFARWLNPEFAIWCNDRIRELHFLKTGITAFKSPFLI